jgi:rSAM/selenodomain-associated transferase 1
MRPRYPNGRILVFAKAPEPGAVKTRLIPSLGAAGAAALAARCILNTVAMARDCQAAPVELHVSPDIRHPFFQALPDAPPLSPQHGDDLGERMHGALAAALADAEFALLIGTDCPALGCDYLRQACAALAEGRDAVLGPAEDGGYVLIGVRRSVPALFDGVEWGSDRVLEQTRQRLVELGWKCLELPTLWDLDRPEDLARLKL